MKILICCETYFPSVGGVQIVLQQIAERIAKRGHDITVATSKLQERQSTIINNVKIKEFDVSGNSIRGITGEVQDYCDYVLAQNYDVLLMKAAQSWSFDAMMDKFDRIEKRKVFIPCGFSGLYYPYYENYYNKMPNILKEFDHLIFYAEDYRDINFAKKHGINNYSIIPNGASEVEFSVEKNTSFRNRIGVDSADYLLMTVGTFTGGKGHTEVAQAFELANFTKSATLVLNGNIPDKIARMTFLNLTKEYLKMGPKSMLIRILNNLFTYLGIKKKQVKENWLNVAQRVNSDQINNKNILITNLKRNDLIQCFLNADLFVFASNIEYSPLVLFESVAAGLPFISVPVGNAIEIADWTQGGIICPAKSDINGRTTVNPEILAEHLSKLLTNKTKLNELGKNGRNNWKKKFTWDNISYQYEKVLKG